MNNDGLVYDKECIELVSSYKYLGVELNSEFNFDRMALSRLGAGWQTVNQISQTLKSKNVPSIFKRMLIMNVLVPRITYGTAYFWEYI